MNTPVILYDGKCSLCNSGIKFVIARDQKKRFKFSMLHSNPSKKLLQEFGESYNKADSIILIDNQKAYLKSAAILRIVKHLGRLYPLLYLFIIIPPAIRNFVYDVIAKNRYKWFGKNDACGVNTQDEDRFF